VELFAIASTVKLVLQSVFDWRAKPFLKIEFDPAEDLGEWHLDGIRQQKVGTVHVRNIHKNTAKRCVAVLRLLSVPSGVRVPQKEFALHWADTDYSTHSNVAERVEIGFERRRLDVVFTVNPLVGAWVAMPLALSVPAAAGQAYLPPGLNYHFLLRVGCENGKGDSREFTVDSPTVWTGLSMRPVKLT